MGIKNAEEITTDILRLFVAFLQGSHNEGGVHAFYRSVHAFINWCEEEYEFDWKNPAKKWKVKKPKATPLPGIKIEIIIRMVDAVDSLRDKALLLFLVETGLRASELIMMDIGHYDPRNGAVHVLAGKGGYTRTVYIESRTRQVVSRYLRTRRPTEDDPLFTTEEDTRLTYSGLREIKRRAAKKIRVKEPGLHDFRRCCALERLRNTGDIVHVSKWLGHQDVKTTMRYLHLEDADLAKFGKIASPVDRWYKK